MAAQSVQFVGADQVLKAFDNYECYSWAVWQQKAMNFSYCFDGSDNGEQSRAELAAWLKMLSGRTNEAVYTLKFYDVANGERITPRSVETCAFNFRLFGEEETRGGGGGRAMFAPYEQQYFSEMLQELKTMRSEIDQLKKQPAQLAGIDGEEPLETWEKILDNPVIVGVCSKLLGIDINALTGEPGKLSGVPGLPGDSDVNEILQRLHQYDEKLTSHLYKLLVIAEQKPATFKMLLGMLDNM